MIKELKTLVKRNRYTFIAMGIFFVVLIIGFIAYKLLFPNTGAPVYGNRLDGIEEVEVTKDSLKELESKIKENKTFKEASAVLKGKTINVSVVVNKGTSKEDARKVTDIVTSYFAKEYIAYYDFQVFIENEDKEEAGYPIIGYKNNDSKTFSFSSAK